MVRWAASASAWVSGYDLQMSVNGGPYADAPVQPQRIGQLHGGGITTQMVAQLFEQAP